MQRTTALDTLAVLEHAARPVAVAESQDVYGHLIFLVRDTLDKADAIHRLIFGEEEADANAIYDDEGRKRRNSTRKSLKNIFREIKGWCLPQPHSDINGERETYICRDGETERDKENERERMREAEKEIEAHPRM